LVDKTYPVSAHPIAILGLLRFSVSRSDQQRLGGGMLTSTAPITVASAKIPRGRWKRRADDGRRSARDYRRGVP